MTKENDFNEHIAILAYGSLIWNPKKEIEQHTLTKIDCNTPFNVEYARKSSSRGDAPTLVPVVHGGSHVKAKLLVLNKDVSLRQAKDMLWKRETHKSGSGKTYNPPAIPGPNTVIIEQLENFHNIDTVLYTKIGSNLDNPTPQRLAELAIESVKKCKDKNGIRYLYKNKENEIITPLTEEYERKILEITKTGSLEEAEANYPN